MKESDETMCYEHIEQQEQLWGEVNNLSVCAIGDIVSSMQFGQVLLGFIQGGFEYKASNKSYASIGPYSETDCPVYHQVYPGYSWIGLTVPLSRPRW